MGRKAAAAARLRRFVRDHTRVLTAWFVFLIAPTLGSWLFEFAGAATGIGERRILESTSVDDVLRAVGLVAGGAIAGYFLLREKSGPAWAIRFDPDELGGKWFPGRLLGGLSLVAAPLLLLAGELLRIRFYFYFPSQLAAFEAHPGLVLASYSVYALGLLLLWPGFLVLTKIIGIDRPGWATWGGALAITGLIVRLYHEGINHLAFQLVTYADLETATAVVRDSYPAWYVLYPLVFADNVAWPVLAVGLYLSGRMTWPYCLALVTMWGHSSGVLKGSDLGLVVYAVGLVVAMLPLGVRLLRDGAGLSRRATIWGLVITVGLIGIYAQQILTMH